MFNRRSRDRAAENNGEVEPKRGVLRRDASCGFGCVDWVNAAARLRRLNIGRDRAAENNGEVEPKQGGLRRDAPCGFGCVAWGERGGAAAPVKHRARPRSGKQRRCWNRNRAFSGATHHALAKTRVRLSSIPFQFACLVRIDVRFLIRIFLIHIFLPMESRWTCIGMPLAQKFHWIQPAFGRQRISHQCKFRPLQCPK